MLWILSVAAIVKEAPDHTDHRIVRRVRPGCEDRESKSQLAPVGIIAKPPDMASAIGFRRTFVFNVLTGILFRSVRIASLKPQADLGPRSAQGGREELGFPDNGNNLARFLICQEFACRGGDRAAERSCVAKTLRPSPDPLVGRPRSAPAGLVGEPTQPCFNACRLAALASRRAIAAFQGMIGLVRGSKNP